MNNYEKLKQRHPLRRDIILIIVLLLLILVAIIFPRFTELREPAEETEIIYIEPENKTAINDDFFSNSDIVGSLLKEMAEKPIPPELIPDSISFEWPVLDTFDTHFSNMVYNQRSHLNYIDINFDTFPDVPGFDSVSTSKYPFFLQGSPIYDTPPAPLGGYDILYDNLSYPKELYWKNIEGSVILQILVQKDGTLGAVRVLKSSHYYAFDVAACKVVAKTKWLPGTCRDRNVPVVISFPLDFKMGDNRINIPPPPPPKISWQTGGCPIYDKQPEPLTPIEKNLVFPEFLTHGDIEGPVVVQTFIDDQGIVQNCIVIKGFPGTGIDEAAIEAIKKTKFKPAVQRDRNVGVWIAIPVTFKLSN
jgi:TonB family protein